MMSFTMAGIVHKAAYAVVGTLAIGAGSLVLHLDHNDTKQDTRIDNLEASIIKLDSVPTTLATIEGEIKVVDQKITDLKEAEATRRK